MADFLVPIAEKLPKLGPATHNLKPVLFPRERPQQT